MGNLWRSCVKVREAIELPFGVVNGVGRARGVLDRGRLDMPKGKRRFWRFGGVLVH